MLRSLKLFVLTVATIGILTSLGIELITSKNANFLDFSISLLFIFSWIIIPISICVIVFYILKWFISKFNFKSNLIVEVLLLLVIFSVGMILMNLPEFYRNKSISLSGAHFAYQNSFFNYLTPGIFLVPVFAVFIPLLNRILSKTN